jgi:hypothetical protein
MEPSCRCCGTERNLKATLSTEVFKTKTKLIEVMAYLGWVNFDRDPNLPQDICYLCFKIICNYSAFVEITKEHQIYIQENKEEFLPAKKNGNLEFF